MPQSEKKYRISLEDRPSQRSMRQHATDASGLRSALATTGCGPDRLFHHRFLCSPFVHLTLNLNTWFDRCLNRRDEYTATTLARPTRMAGIPATVFKTSVLDICRYPACLGSSPNYTERTSWASDSIAGHIRCFGHPPDLRSR